MGDYVNSPVHEGRNERENSHSGKSKLFCMVGVSFGLLCIIQSALNVSLRLYGIRSTKSTNSTLLREEDQLEQQNRELQAINSYLTRNNTMLNDQLSRQKDLITQLQTEKEMLVRRLPGKEQELFCPPGWSSYMSMCYQLSTEKKSWSTAKEDCVEKGAHLVILNDKFEEDILHVFANSAVWIGLKTDNQLGTWTWVDGSRPTYTNSFRRQSDTQQGDRRYSCIYSEQFLDSARWVVASCRDEHHWVCEMAQK